LAQVARVCVVSADPFSAGCFSMTSFIPTRILLRLWMLATMLAAIGANGRPVPKARSSIAGGQKHSNHRVIVRYAGASAGQPTVRADIQNRVERLQAQPNVIRAQPLPQLGMAVVSLDSADAGEQLVETLQRDASVELAVPDTWVSAFDLFGAKDQGFSGTVEHHRALRAIEQALPAQCSAHPACRMRRLVGDCCPAGDGMILSCCSSRSLDLISLQTHHGTYITAGQNGTVSQIAGTPSDQEKFEIFMHGDGTISLRSHYGKYVTASKEGIVRADREQALDWEKFKKLENEDGTISLESFFGKYFAVDGSGVIVAKRVNASLGDRFRIQLQVGPDQRLADDPALPKLWGLHSLGGFDIDALEAWKIWTGEVGKGITVAVIDTGIDYTHEDLREQMWMNPYEIPGNGVDDDENGYIDDIHGADFANEDGDPMDDQMHGTHCAGTIAGIGNNDIGVSGVAWRGVRLMALKFLTSTGSGRTSDAIRAIDYAVAHGAKIASNSWGGGGSSSALRVAIEHAEAAGMLFTAAAGNEAANNDEVANYPANYDIANVISVASTTSIGKLSEFSCYGSSTVHVAAPGSGIYSTIPHNKYATHSGTSMAAPYVSGLAALVWMYRPQLSMHQVREIIIGSVRKLPALEGKVITGGLINAKNALEAAWAFEPPRPPANAPQAIAFEDTDPRIGVFGGVITITAAANQSDVEYYRVYMVSGAGFQLEAVGDPIPVTGEQELILEFNTSFVSSEYAKALVAVSGRSLGEMPARLRGIAPHTDLVDYGLPVAGPKAASWSGDKDPREGFVKGSIFVDRAGDETSITEYNVYWHAATGIRGPKVGSIPGIDFMEPTCSGLSCALIDRSKTVDGEYVFERGAYGDNEQATISLSGPGRVEVTAFETELYYDSLTVAGVELSGNMTEFVPGSVELPEGDVVIEWSSDEFETASGWSFQLRQDGATAELDVDATEILGSGFEVVPAYGANELTSRAIVVDITDSTSTSASTALPGNKRRLTASQASQYKRSDTTSHQSVEEFPPIETPEPKQQSERWLHRPMPNSEGRVLWVEHRAVQLSEVAARPGRVRGSFTVSGLDEAAATQPAVRSAFARSLAAQLPSIEDGRMQLVRILSVRSGMVKIEFEVELSANSQVADLDRIEAELLLLRTGQRAAARFDAALTAGLAASGLAMLTQIDSWHAVVGSPQQLSPKMLASTLVPAGEVQVGGSFRLRRSSQSNFV